MKRTMLILILAAIFCGGCFEPQEDYCSFGMGFTGDYETKHEMFVSVGNINNPTPDDVERWTDETIDFWVSRYPDIEQCIWEVTPYVYALFYDRNYIIYNGMQVAGQAYCDNKRIEISCCGDVKVRGVFIHELSHIYVWECFHEADGNIHHAFFEKIGLNEFTIY